MEQTLAASAPYQDHLPKRRARPTEKGRNPYDGLRPWSAITHGIGAVLSILGAVLLLVNTVRTGGDAWKIVSFSVYSASMICLYVASTLYHCINTSVKGRLALRKYDHASIYLLIAGTYTPMCLVALRGPWGWTAFGIVWAIALAGLFFTLFWIDCPRGLTAGIYLAMGWFSVILIRQLWLSVGWRGLFWLALGGVLYTVGGVLYALKWPGRDNPRFGCHEIFHVFILLGSVAHYLLMYRVIMPF